MYPCQGAFPTLHIPYHCHAAIATSALARSEIVEMTFGDQSPRALSSNEDEVTPPKHEASESTDSGLSENRAEVCCIIMESMDQILAYDLPKANIHLKQQFRNCQQHRR